ncbi:MAG: HAMP domain-containing histidine kinase [Cyanobacteria bacterium SIG30]|nr:HAMP domain-containing histidine kinase [Cyanobacteria bacterium SIG30]
MNNLSNILDIKEFKKELNLEKDYFVTILTHYLKTPIRAQITALELLLNDKFGTLQKEQKTILNHLISSNQHIWNMAENILTKYQSDDEKILIKKKNCDIKKILNDVLDKLKFIICQNQQIIVLKAGFLPLNIEIDEQEISKVFSNLILNALDHSKKNSEITISLTNKGNFIEVEIQDTGFGIDKKILKNIFKKNLYDNRKYRKIGSGLGLYVCKKIIEAHNGEIYIKKTDKSGTNIVFTLPFVSTKNYFNTSL